MTSVKHHTELNFITYYLLLITVFYSELTLFIPNAISFNEQSYEPKRTHHA